MMKRGAIAVLFLVGACVEVETEVAPEVATTAEEVIAGCPKFGCGENSATIETWDFHELNELGLPNLEGIRLIGLRRGGVLHTVHVDGDRLIATHPNGSIATGSALVGSYMEVQVPGPGSSTTIGRIYIMGVSNVVSFWVGTAESGPIETYHLMYNNPALGTTQRPLCRHEPGRQDPEGQMWQKTDESILFTGDRYHSGQKTVESTGFGATQGWFNIACAGSVLAKLHLNRHTEASSTAARQTSWARRQTLLKMYVSDVCGNGTSMTVTGTPLHWQNTTHWSMLTGSESSIEGFWGPQGAYCIENHRLSPTYDPAIAACVDQCSTVMPLWPAWYRGAYIKTANP